MSLIIYIIAVL